MTFFKSDKTGFTFSFKFQKVVRNSKITKMANNEKEYLERKEIVESDISSHKCCWRFQAIQVF